MFLLLRDHSHQARLTTLGYIAHITVEEHVAWTPQPPKAVRMPPLVAFRGSDARRLPRLCRTGASVAEQPHIAIPGLKQEDPAWVQAARSSVL